MIALRSKKAVWMLSLAVVALAVAGAWALTGGKSSNGAKDNVSDEFSVESFEKQLDDPGKMFDTMRTTMQREDLTDEQRRQIGQNMRTVMENYMQKRVDEYQKAATQEDKNAVLDRHIDQMQGFMQAMEKRREEAQGNEKEGDREKREEQMRRTFGPQTQEQRKAQSESRNPDQMASRMAYFGAMGKRMQERGIQMPRGGGFGMFGRGPGGPGGGGQRGGNRGGP